MRTLQQSRQDVHDLDDEAFEDWDSAEGDEGEVWEFHRVTCPECAQPIAVRAGASALPPHARCATRWDPFGPSVCTGSGRAVTDVPFGDLAAAREDERAMILSLPQGLDWRTQPFSHAA